MVKAVNPARMNFRLEFGSEGPTDKVNPNTGNAIMGFVPAFSLWAGQWSLSLQQQLTLAGNGAQDSAVFFTRYTDSVQQGMELRRNGTDVYQIDQVSFDDGLPPDGFNLITCHKVVSGHA